MTEPRTASTSKRLMSIKELLSYYGATDWFWRSQIWSGRLPVVRTGKKQFVDVADVEQLIKTYKMTQ